MIKPEDLKSLQEGHRARLRQKFLDGKLSDYEILELLLTYVIPRRDVRTLSRQLHKKYGNIHQVLSAPMEDLIKNEGIKENTATFFKLIHEITTIDYKIALDKRPIFHNYEKLENYCKILLGTKTIEEFHVFYLDGQLKLIEDQLHSTGTVNYAAVYVREIAKRALELSARSIVMVHNHPTANMAFSSEDIATTKDVACVLKKLDIDVYDHLLVSGDVIYSARNLHLLNDLLE